MPVDVVLAPVVPMVLVSNPKAPDLFQVHLDALKGDAPAAPPAPAPAPRQEMLPAQQPISSVQIVAPSKPQDGYHAEMAARMAKMKAGK